MIELLDEGKKGDNFPMHKREERGGRYEREKEAEGERVR